MEILGRAPGVVLADVPNPLAATGADPVFVGRVRRDPTSPNLRQVHLIHAELHDELRARGFDVGPGEMGENVTTRGVDLLGDGQHFILVDVELVERERRGGRRGGGRSRRRGGGLRVRRAGRW